MTSGRIKRRAFRKVRARWSPRENTPLSPISIHAADKVSRFFFLFFFFSIVGAVIGSIISHFRAKLYDITFEAPVFSRFSDCFSIADFFVSLSF